ncbi:porin family protein [Cecembia rubra]|uniref:Outer membrane protein with beta-barrel domain n=1 Tax=Cecembia rubra TaxID=1485585 RepID=A0A2P8DL41_9BACT|nr:porin family protein [Cecembia rubra]PSK97933.1 outer membrane protein with beta-barrel domain [Cecembia rubra]
MRKLSLITLLLCLIVSSEVFAQFGVRAGANISNFQGFDYESRIGMHLGAYYDLDLNSGFSIEPGLFFSQKGFKSNNLEIKENVNYIDIPVLVRYHFEDIFNVFAGPQGSLTLSRNYSEGNFSSKDKNILRGYDFAAVLGAGIKLPYDMNFQLSYDFGLLNLNYFDQNVKNRAFKISVGKSF